MYRPYEDANNSQFMIMNRPNQTYDFDFSVFGMLVEGESVRRAISEVPATPDGRPTSDVIVTDTEVINDSKNRVLILRTPAERTNGTAVVTVTATAGDRTESRSFEATVTPNGFRFEPYLEDIPTLTTPVDACGDVSADRR